MDKQKLTAWLEQKIEQLSVVPISFKDSEVNTAYLRGAFTALEELKTQVNDGKFEDKS